ncbi:MAG: hypothetical protein ACRCWG_05225 [Sarcina sp.]
MRNVNIIVGVVIGLAAFGFILTMRNVNVTARVSLIEILEKFYLNYEECKLRGN